MAAFSHLLAAHTVRTHRAALGLLGDEQEAREAAQEALSRAWAARDRYDPALPFYPWLATILRNVCRDLRARASHRAVAGLDEERVAGGETPLAALDAATARARVRAGLDRLDPEHREILVMRHFEDLSYAEIAETLGVPVGTVMSRLFRARRALLAHLEDA